MESPIADGALWGFVQSMGSVSVVTLADAITRRMQAHEQYFNALARRYGYRSFAELSKAAEEAEDMARKLGFASFDAFVRVEHERRKSLEEEIRGAKAAEVGR